MRCARHGSSYPGARLKVIPPAEGAPLHILNALRGVTGWNVVGKYAEAFFKQANDSGEQNTISPFDRLTLEDAKTWLNRDKWTVREAASLLCGIDPSALAITDYYPWPEDLSDDARKMVREGKRVLEYLENAIDRNPSNSAVCFPTLNGFATKYRDDGNFYNDRSEFKFSLRAYFVSALSIANNDGMGINIPCFGIFHDEEKETEAVTLRGVTSTVYEPILPELFSLLRNRSILQSKDLNVSEWPRTSIDEGEDCECVADRTKTIPTYDDWRQLVEQTPAPDVDEVLNACMPVAPEAVKSVLVASTACIPSGAPLTIDHIRALLDQEHPRYQPELAAAVETWCSFEVDPMVKDRTPKDEIKSRLKDWDKGKPLSTTALERIAIVVNWEKTPAKN